MLTHHTFSYSKAQFELLSECISINDGLSAALFVFFDTEKLDPNAAGVLEWLRQAELIKANPLYIEEKFNQLAQTQVCSVEFVPPH